MASISPSVGKSMGIRGLIFLYSLKKGRLRTLSSIAEPGKFNEREDTAAERPRLGVLYPFAKQEDYDIIWAWANGLLILFQGSSRARRWGKQVQHPRLFHIYKNKHSLTAESGCYRRKVFMPMNNYSIHITYGEDIRSIDLENILSGIRLIGEHELSKQKGKHVRNYTDCFRIKSVEKGSIIINFNIDVDLNLNLMLLLSCAITAYRSSNLPTLLNTAISGIRSAVKRGVVIHIKRDNKGLQDVEINGDFDGTLCIGKDGGIKITNNKQS